VPLPIAEAIARLENTIAEWCRDAFASNNVGAPPQLGVRATAGFGKTRKLLQILVEKPTANKRNIDVYVPQHRLADELAFELDTIMGNISSASRRRLRVQVIRGREYVGHSGTAMCAKAEIAGQIARAGHEVWRHSANDVGKMEISSVASITAPVLTLHSSRIPHRLCVS
jgi:hypothetical protein